MTRPRQGVKVAAGETFMQIVIGILIYFTVELGLGIVTGKLLRYRRCEKPTTPVAILLDHRSVVAAHLAAAER